MMNVLRDYTGSPNGLNGNAAVGNAENELKKARIDEHLRTSGVMDASNGHHATNGHGLPHLNGNGAHSAYPHHSQSTSSSSSSPNTSNGSSGAISRVVHLRGIPTDFTEAELITFGMAFGKIQNLLILKGKNQAFLEFVDEQSAMHMVSYYSSHACILRGRQCYIQYSTHKELRTDQSNNAASFRVQSALKASNLLQNQANLIGSPLIPSLPNGAHSGGPNAILRVVVENPLYPVTLDLLSGIFCRYGKIDKIIVFTKNGQFQALIQFADRQCALMAKQQLDGQSIYSGCCTLRIEYSRLDSLRVQHNNDKSRDYTNPHLPAGDSGPGMLLPDPLQQFQAAMGLSPLASAMGGLAPSLMPSLGPSGALPHYGASLLHGLAAGGANMSRMMGGVTILVSNMNEELMTPENIFTLFGVYGDVMRVKILYNKKDTAMVQFAEPRQAALAIQHLDRVRVFGKQLKVSLSKHPEVQMPKDGQPDSGLTRDFSNSPLHRFKKPGSKNYQNIYPPSCVLHLSNIPPNITEEDLKTFFMENGFDVKNIRFFPNDHRMALMELSSVEEATEALIKMHNFQLNENTHLRVSFSKGTVKDH